MPIAKGKFGVRYQQNDDETGLNLFKFIPLVIVIVVGVVIFVLRGCSHDGAEESIDGAPQHVRLPASSVTMPVNANALALAKKWLATSPQRNVDDRALLERLVESEKAGNFASLVNTLSRMRINPRFADIEDPVSRRLGDLHVYEMFTLSVKEGSQSSWTVPVKVKPSDNLQRIAREHGTTKAAICRINALRENEPLKAGAVLQVPEFPNTVLVVHRRSGIVDAIVAKRFFKRYYVMSSADTPRGPVLVGREDEPKALLGRLGLRGVAKDIDEIVLFLAPGSSIVVTDS